MITVIVSMGILNMPLMAFAMQIENAQALASPDDCILAEEIAKSNGEVQDLLRDRGITDMASIACDPWSGKPSIWAFTARIDHRFSLLRSAY